MSTDRPEPEERGGSLASSTADQVRAIIEAAENSAAEIQRQAAAPLQSILERLDAMRAELATLIEGLSHPGAGEPAPPPVPHPAAPPVPHPTPGAAPVSPPVPESAPEAPPEAAVSAGGGYATGETEAPSDPDIEGARLIALNMALNGSPREEADRYLTENFPSLTDRAGLLDDVYSSIQA